MRTLTRYLLDLLYPNRCPGCDMVIHAGELVCQPCGERMLLEHDGYCHICGKAACVCKSRRFAYDKAAVCCRYADEAVHAVIEMKLSRNTNLAYFAARILAERLQHSADFRQPDCVMPVPMHPSKIRRRGYNQAALIGRELASLLRLPYREDVLYKDKSTHAQHELTAQQRAENVSCFGARNIRIDGQCVLLCDDVLTTGSTMSRCAALLKECGAVHVIAAAAATTIPKEEYQHEYTGYRH